MKVLLYEEADGQPSIDIVRNAINDEWFQKRLNSGEMYGEIGVVNSIIPSRYHAVYMDSVSHRITKVWIEDNKLYGEIQILENFRGGELLNIVLRNSKDGLLKLRMRAIVDKNNSTTFLDIITFDIGLLFHNGSNVQKIKV